MKAAAIEKIKRKATLLSKSHSLGDLYFELGLTISDSRPIRRVSTFQGGPRKRIARKTDPRRLSQIGKQFALLQLKRIQKFACNTKTQKPKRLFKHEDLITLITGGVVELKGGPGYAGILLAIAYKQGLAWICKL